MAGLNKLKFLIFIFLCINSLAIAQQQGMQRTKIQILHADFFSPQIELNRNKLLGNVSLKHGGMFMTCDSLYQYPDSNYVEAYGNVHAIQNDTVNLWGDYLTYDGNSKLAQVRNNVKLQDDQITLTTHFLDYNMFVDIGYYFNNGKIYDELNTLTSKNGYYFTRDNEMFFKDSVRVKTPEYYMESDTLKYTTDSKIISITGPTTIVGEKRQLYSEDGWYNSLSAHTELYKNNKIYYNDYQGSADTITVDSISGIALMYNNIHLYDTVNNVIIEGDFGKILQNNDYAFVTKKAIMTLVGETDSLFVHGDTLSLTRDSAQNNIMQAYYNTKFYNKELQGVCDSMRFPAADSTIYLYGEMPIVWASGNQMTANNIDMVMKNGEVSLFHLNEKSMIVNKIDSTKYNQIKGRNMIGHLAKNELYLVDVDGSGETLYYPDDKGEIVGMNKATSSFIKIYIDKRKVKDIVFISNVEGKLIPIHMVEPSEMFLSEFKWLIDYQPKKKEDIFIKTEIINKEDED